MRRLGRWTVVYDASGSVRASVQISAPSSRSNSTRVITRWNKVERRVVLPGLTEHPLDLRALAIPGPIRSLPTSDPDFHLRLAGPETDIEGGVGGARPHR